MWKRRITKHGEEEERGLQTFGHGDGEKGPPAACQACQPPAMGKRRNVTGHREVGGGALGAAHHRRRHDGRRIMCGLSGLKACWDSSSEFLTIQIVAL